MRDRSVSDLVRLERGDRDRVFGREVLPDSRPNFCYKILD